MPQIIIISGPSGTGKGTVIEQLMKDAGLQLSFSISATNRAPRGSERHGVEYYFLSNEEFIQSIAQERFIEYVEVYPGRFYGTLKSEVERVDALGQNLLLDIDVEGAIRVKELYGEQALSIFLQPPSIDTLRLRLEKRGTETKELIESRLQRAAYELSFAPQFDRTFINDDLSECVCKVKDAIQTFICNGKRSIS